MAEMPELGVAPRSTGTRSGSRCSMAARMRSREVNSKFSVGGAFRCGSDRFRSALDLVPGCQSGACAVRQAVAKRPEPFVERQGGFAVIAFKVAVMKIVEV